MTTQLNDLLAMMAQLRDPVAGCAWDKAQNFQTIVPYTLEEAYEVADAIERGDYDALKDELGDLLFQVVFYSQLASEQGYFQFDDCVAAICDKLTRRHPHIFSVSSATESPLMASQALQQWEAYKQQERREAGLTSVLDNVPVNLPALTRAYKLQKRCASVGFDWPTVEGCWEKVREEIIEVEQTQAGSVELADELGDLMFALVNVIRKHGLEPETILRQANQKFERRFRAVEAQLAETSSPVGKATLAEMDARWQSVKTQER